MRFYVAVTNNDWFHHLAALQPDEVNFWRPRSQQDFRTIPIGAPFLFKLHHPFNFIAGGGFFLKHTFLPIQLMWQAFGEKNGVPDFPTLRARILEHRAPDEMSRQIGCTLLSEPFFFPEEAWIPSPPDWARSIMVGKTYNTEEAEGAALWTQVTARLAGAAADERLDALQEGARYGAPQTILPRLGQGGFQILVTDAYTRRCAITGERTLPALEAHHIRPFSEEGPHRTDNGLLLRSDWHRLFDEGYATLTNDHRVLVSRKIRDEFENGREYYAFDRQALTILPDQERDRPSKEFLEWHRDMRFRG